MSEVLKIALKLLEPISVSIQFESLKNIIFLLHHAQSKVVIYHVFNRIVTLG